MSQSSYTARNTDIRNTDSDLLAFADADMTVPEDWLKADHGTVGDWFVRHSLVRRD